MALVKAKRDDLLGPLTAVSGIIERRHTLPILSNVLIDRADSVLSFLATDIEIQITARSNLAAGGEARPVTVGARKLVDILRALPEGAEVTVTQQDKRLQVKAGKSRFTLQTLPAEDFPKLARPAGEVPGQLRERAGWTVGGQRRSRRDAQVGRQFQVGGGQLPRANRLQQRAGLGLEVIAPLTPEGATSRVAHALCSSSSRSRSR